MKFQNENTYDPLVITAAGRYGIPQMVIKAVIGKESSFVKTTDTGSVGLMQLELATARGLGFTGTREQLFDPATNIDLGVKFLRELYDRYPTEPWDAIYAAYNSGKVRRNPYGKFVDRNGDTQVEDHVVGFRKLMDYFWPAWRTAASGPLGGGRQPPT
jgi:soluble lytic murein transglycosylase-like protein